LELVKIDDLAELDIEAAPLRPEDARALDQVADVLGLLVAPRELVDERTLFDDAFIPDRNRDELDLGTAKLRCRLEDHRQKPILWRKRLADSGPAALQEELHGEPFGEQLTQIGLDEHGVERVAMEAATNEERAASTQ
jgi:hypothetical protein